MMAFRVLALVPALVVVWAGSLSGQHAFTPEEIADGGRIYQSVCAGCHGLDGDAIAGANLMTGAFRRAAEEEELIELIRLGIPGTGMPPNAVTAEQAGLIVGYLRSMAGVPSFADAAAGGNAARGRELFQTRGCMNCHRVDGEGGRRGPDLSRVGAVPRGGRGFVPPTADEIRARLARSIVDPNAEVAPADRTFRVVTNSGAVVTGRLLNHDTHAVSILADGERVETFQRADLAEAGLSDSPMPSFRDRLSATELADLVSYLAMLTGD